MEWRDTTLNYDQLLQQLNKKSFKLKMAKSLRKRALFAESTTQPLLQECIMTIRNGRIMTLSPSPPSLALPLVSPSPTAPPRSPVTQCLKELHSSQPVKDQVQLIPSSAENLAAMMVPPQRW